MHMYNQHIYIYIYIYSDIYVLGIKTDRDTTYKTSRDFSDGCLLYIRE